ncbi:hypothetical protein RN001_001213 [Aquatica leii]|uniref:PWWP domain-containing protein n=1 Tax=Aquatica leii TaxID=1421715 RepID=A0AAN7SJH2_9COLE|nr:hypothetical protein RN001_001213 [Aquatica leii]
MKKVTSFNVGDKVFAKVKGYPAWPATIIEDQTTKFNVRFYGTGETGIVKSKDLFYYLKHKKSFIKSLKRKDYNEAIEEIENAIKECGGTDGNSEEIIDATSSPPGKVETTENTKNKRKRSDSLDKTNGNVSKKLAVENTSNNDLVPETSQNKITKKVLPERSPRKLKTRGSTNIKDVIETATVKETEQSEEPKENEENTEDIKNEEVENEAVTVNELETTEKYVTAADIKIVTEDYLAAVVSYAEFVKSEETKYKKKPVENRQKFENQVVLIKMPSGKFVGIKYNKESPPQLSNEFDQAVYDATEAKTVLSLKKLVEEGKCNPESDKSLFMTNISIKENEIQEILRSEIIQRKKDKINQLKIESNLIELDANIKKCLGLDKAQPQKAVECLEEMLKLNILPLMLKKHPHVVEMIKRLGKYIGNVGEWDFSKEQLDDFEVQAEIVRKKANEVFTKFAKLFDVSNETMLWKVFNDEVEHFKDQVKHMTEGAIFSLTSEPNSRQSFLDKIEDVEKSNIIVSNEDEKPENDTVNEAPLDSSLSI